jgi:hypothetical protein
MGSVGNTVRFVGLSLCLGFLGAAEAQFPLDNAASYKDAAVRDARAFTHNSLEVHSIDAGGTAVGTKKKLYLLTSGGAGPGGLGDVMNAVIPSFQLALDDINNNTAVLPNVQLALMTAGDSRCCQSCTTRNVLEALHDRTPTDGWLIGFLGDFCSGGGCLQVNDFAKALRMPVFSPYCQSGLLSDTGNYPAFTRYAVHSVIQGRSVGDFIADVVMPAATNIHGANPEIAGKVRYGSVYWYKSINSGAVKATAQRLTERLGASKIITDTSASGVSEQHIQLNGGEPSNFEDASGKRTPEWQQLTDAIANMKKHDYRMVVISFYQTMGTAFFCEVYRQKWYGYHTFIWVAMWLDFNWIEQGYASKSAMLTAAGCTKENLYEAAQGMIGVGTSFWNPDPTGNHELSGRNLQNVRNTYREYCRIDANGNSFASSKNGAAVGGLYPTGTSTTNLADYTDSSKCNNNFGPYGYDALWSVANTLDQFLKNGGDINRLESKPQGGLNDTTVAAELHEIAASESWYC